MKRNRRAGVEDRWSKTVRDEQGNTQTVRSAPHGKGLRWRARYVGPDGKERAKHFARKRDAQAWVDGEVTTKIGTHTWVDPSLSREAFARVAEAWFATKASKSPKTKAGYRSILDTVVLPRWGDPVWRISRSWTCRHGSVGCRSMAVCDSRTAYHRRGLFRAIRC